MLEITIKDCDYNFFKVDRPEYSPYFKHENAVMLQDGLCLMVKSVAARKVKKDPKNSFSEDVSIVMICLENISSLDVKTARTEQTLQTDR